MNTITLMVLLGADLSICWAHKPFFSGTVLSIFKDDLF